MIFFGLRGRRRAVHYGRPIPAITRLRHTIGLAVETGQRLHISLGRGQLAELQAGSPIIGLRVLQRMAGSTLVSDRPPLATSGESVIATLSQNTLRHAYRQAGQAHSYDPTQGRVTGLTPFSYAAGVMPLIEDENISASILAGHFGSEIGLVTDAAERAESFTVGGSDDLAAQSVLFAGAREALIGEELYAAGAYLQAGPLHTASLQAQDIMRWVIGAGLLLGAGLKLVGVI